MTNGQPHKCHKNRDHWHLPWCVHSHLMAISHQLYSFFFFFNFLEPVQPPCWHCGQYSRAKPIRTNERESAIALEHGLISICNICLRPWLKNCESFWQSIPSCFHSFSNGCWCFPYKAPWSWALLSATLKKLYAGGLWKTGTVHLLPFLSQILNCYWIYPPQLLPWPSVFAIVPSVWEAESKNIPLCPQLYLFHVCALPAGYEYKFRATCYLSLMMEPEVISISLCENNCRKHLYDLVPRVCLALDLFLSITRLYEMSSWVAAILAGKRGRAEQGDQVIWRWDVVGRPHGPRWDWRLAFGNAF